MSSPADPSPAPSLTPSVDYSHKFCVIGAGPSGLAVAKNFLEARIPFDGFEREDDVGGNWYFGKRSSSVYASTHMISSKRMTEYPDFPMPRDYPPYPSHQQALAYLRAYARQFDLYRAFTFESSVERVDPVDDHWRVTVSGETTPRRYRGVVIANGHHWDPLRAEMAGDFAGQRIHARDYKTPDLLRGKRVLVVGVGNSGCDIAVESGQHAAATFLSFRRGYHFLPKFLFGRPLDSGGERLNRWGLPQWARRWLTSGLVRVALGKPESYGLPTPDHRLFEAHPIVNSQLLYSVGHGRIQVKPAVRRLAGEQVEFADGSREPIDLIVEATGYRLSFPFLDPRLVCDEAGRPELFLNLFHPRRDDLFVVGLIQPNSGLWALADEQAKLVAAFLDLRRRRPQAADWLCRLKAENRDDPRGGLRFVDSPRHVIEVDYYAYRQKLRRLQARLARS